MSVTSAASAGQLTTSYAALCTVGGSNWGVAFQVVFTNTDTNARIINVKLNTDGTDRAYISRSLDPVLTGRDAGGVMVLSLVGLPANAVIKAKADAGSVVNYQVLYGSGP